MSAIWYCRGICWISTAGIALLFPHGVQNRPADPNEFIRDGYFERHLNKMRMRYRAKHDLLLTGLEPFKKQFMISGGGCGLHLLLTAKGNVTEQELLERAAAEKVKAYGIVREYGGSHNAESYRAVGLWKY